MLFVDDKFLEIFYHSWFFLLHDVFSPVEFPMALLDYRPSSTCLSATLLCSWQASAVKVSVYGWDRNTKPASPNLCMCTANLWSYPVYPASWHKGCDRSNHVMENLSPSYENCKRWKVWGISLKVLFLLQAACRVTHGRSSNEAPLKGFTGMLF